MRAVENGDLAFTRLAYFGAPDEMVRKLERAWRLETGRCASLRIENAENFFDQAVLAASSPPA